MTMTFELQDSLRSEQLRSLGEFANTYVMHKFRLDDKAKLLHVDYDASRLRETQIENILRHARIPVLRRVPSAT